MKVLTRLKTDIRDKTDSESLYSLLWNHGPALSVRRNESIGYASEIIVLHAFNDHDALVVMDETPYLLWAPSTAGMSIRTKSSCKSAMGPSSMFHSKNYLQLISRDLRLSCDAVHAIMAP
ncbi:MAG: hypothetical protein ABI557_03485 [Aureliella sp.]